MRRAVTCGRTGATVVTGNISSAQLSTSGAGAVYVSGLTQSAVVSSTGTGSIYLNASSGMHAVICCWLATSCT